MILIVVNASTRRDELHPAFAHTAVALALHSQLSQMSFPALSVCTLESHKHWEPQEQAQLAERVPALEQSTSSAQNPLWETFFCKESAAAGDWKATKRRDCGREELMLPASPGYACPSCWDLSVCISLSILQETSASPQAVPENLIFLLMIHLPPHCIKDIKWVS